MYSLIIVEDEFTTRRALMNLIPWKELGFRVDGDFSDGSDVLEYLKSNVPDVILTDIKMTDISGMEIARRVKEFKIPTKIVFLSAYGEFSFAQEAMEYGVDHYLLKPVDLSKLRNTFRKIKVELDEHAALMLQQRERVERYTKLISYEKQQLVTDLYLGSLKDPGQLHKRLELINLTQNEIENCCLYLLEFVLTDDDNYKRFLENYGRQVLQEQLTYILSNIDKSVEFYPIIWNDTSKEAFKILGVLWVNESDNSLKCQTEAIRNEVKNWTSLSMEILDFQLLNSFEDLARSAEQIGRQESQDYLVNDLAYLELLKEQNKLLCSYLLQNKQEQVEELCNSLAENCIKGGKRFAQHQFVYTVIKLIDELSQNNLLYRNQLYADCLDDSIGGLRMDALKLWFKKSIRYLFEIACKQSENGDDTSVDKILTYLRKHFNEDISLTSISENVFLNPTYISRLIKKKLGKNYSEILMEIRIENAVELLKTTDMHVYDIAERVGYSNLKYFYKVFRKVTGKTPGEFRGEN